MNINNVHNGSEIYYVNLTKSHKRLFKGLMEVPAKHLFTGQLLWCACLWPLRADINVLLTDVHWKLFLGMCVDYIVKGY